MIKTTVKWSKLVFCTYLSHFLTVLDDFFRVNPSDQAPYLHKSGCGSAFPHPGDDPCHCLYIYMFYKCTWNSRHRCVSSATCKRVVNSVMTTILCYSIVKTYLRLETQMRLKSHCSHCCCVNRWWKA